MSDKPQAVNSALNTLLGWRKVEDELPPEGVCVLVYCPQFKHSITAGIYNQPSMSGEMGWHKPPHGWSQMGTVTHWMPLPEKPL